MMAARTMNLTWLYTGFQHLYTDSRGHHTDLKYPHSRCMDPYPLLHKKHSKWFSRKSQIRNAVRIPASTTHHFKLAFPNMALRTTHKPHSPHSGGGNCSVGLSLPGKALQLKKTQRRKKVLNDEMTKILSAFLWLLQPTFDSPLQWMHLHTQLGLRRQSCNNGTWAALWKRSKRIYTRYLAHTRICCCCYTECCLTYWEHTIWISS